MRILHDLNVNFMGKRKLMYMLSGVIILAGFISILVRGLAFGLDFTGGTELVFRFPRAVEIGELRSMLAGANVGTFEIKSFGKDTDYIIRTQQLGVGGKISNEVKDLMNKNFDNKMVLLQENRVEAKIGSEMRQDAVIAIFAALVGILLYIAFRFKFVFGIGAVVALFHDVLLTLGVVSLSTGLIPGLNLEFDQAMVAAFLTLIGYSINDTVIVFDRVRENMKLFKTADFEETMNKSVNKTMSRTILTGGTTILTMIALLLFGGEPTRGFAYAMTIGVITGTYSSVFVASAMTLDWVTYRKSKITF
ncbi:MAG: protein translocase subunit SecF [Ignavibacteriae bacterium]|nr:protein translocase subunit SecF [Ignavibacteriota bacterium]